LSIVTEPDAARRRAPTERLGAVTLMIGQLGLGGTEKQVALLAAGLHARGVRTTVLVMFQGGPHEETLRSSGVPVVHLGFRSHEAGWGRMLATNVAAFLRLVRHLRRSRPDVLHAFLYHSYVTAAPAARLAGVPVLVAGRRSLGDFKQGRRLHLAIERMATRWTDLLIANAMAVAEDTRRQESVPAEKITVVYNGLPDSAFEAPPLPARSTTARRTPVSAPAPVPALSSPSAAAAAGTEAGAATGAVTGAGGMAPAPYAAEPAELDSALPVVLCVANLMAYKGHRHLIDAAARLAKRGRPCTLALAGEGPERAELERQAECLGIDVRFLGARTDVDRLLARAEMVVLASLQEGMSNAVMEAMAAGRPVVATEVGGTGELLRGGRGVLVPPADPGALADGIDKLLADPSRAARLAARARAWCRAHAHVDAMVDEHIRIYRELLERTCAG
jgi:glycosyltransferase involved in cell wall biosynthesis